MAYRYGTETNKASPVLQHTSDVRLSELRLPSPIRGLRLTGAGV